MKKLLFTFLTCSILFLSNIVRGESVGELVEVYLINQIDEKRGYCLDVKGYKLRADVKKGIQAHTCYSYQGQIAVDQGFNKKKIMNNQFFLPGFNVCMEASSIAAPGKLLLKDCNLKDVQKFMLMNDGKINLVSNKKLCLTASQGESRKGGGGSPAHLIRSVLLQPCSDKLMNYQKWNIRSDQ